MKKLKGIIVGMLVVAAGLGMVGCDNVDQIQDIQDTNPTIENDLREEKEDSKEEGQNTEIQKDESNTNKETQKEQPKQEKPSTVACDRCGERIYKDDVKVFNNSNLCTYCYNSACEESEETDMEDVYEDITCEKCGGHVSMEKHGGYCDNCGAEYIR